VRASTACPQLEGCNALDTFDDLEDIASTQLDAAMTELLVTGAVEVDDAPPGFDRVAGLINKAQGPATPEELAARAATVTTFAAKVQARRVARADTKVTFAFPKFAAKVLALAAPFILLAGGVTAATGSLPAPAQRVVSGALSSLGVSVPEPHDPVPGSDVHSVTGAPISSTGEAAATGRARATVGLCRAWKVGRLTDQSAAYRTLVAAAGGASSLPAHCAGVSASPLPDGTTGHSENPASDQLDKRQSVTKASSTGGHKSVAHGDRRGPKATAIRRSASVTSEKGRHPGRRPPVAARPSVPRGTDQRITATTRSRGHRPSTKAHHRKAAPTKSSTPGTSGTTSSVGTSPVPSSTLPGRGASDHRSRTGRPRRPRGCNVSTRPGHVIRHHGCHPETPTGSASSTAASTG
jgi:hypothetical protein